jgi:hypothetical protein
MELAPNMATNRAGGHFLFTILLTLGQSGRFPGAQPTAAVGSGPRQLGEPQLASATSSRPSPFSLVDGPEGREEQSGAKV